MQQAERDAVSLPFLWRLKYALSPRDPLYLDTPEDEMVLDLLTHHFHEEAARRNANPAQWELEQKANDPEFGQELEDRKSQILGSDDWKRRHAALARRGKPPQEEVANTTLRVRAKRTPKPVKP